MNYNRFSVSMCVYGGDNPQWFETATNSILNQTLTPSEVVLVVDGPVPEELDSIINDYEVDPSFKVIRLETNQGHGVARRIGLENCSNSLVALMDADDISDTVRFEKEMLRFLEDPTLDIVGGMITEFVEDPNNIVGKREVPELDADIKQYIKKRCPMNQVTVMFKRDSVNQVGGYMDWYCEEDYYLWLRMFLAKMKFANVPDVLVNVRVGKEMYQRRGGMKYFKSEIKLQRFMLDNRVIGFGTYLVNVTKRLILQVLMPDKLRGWVFRKFARS